MERRARSPGASCPGMSVRQAMKQKVFLHQLQTSVRRARKPGFSDMERGPIMVKSRQVRATTRRSSG